MVCDRRDNFLISLALAASTGCACIAMANPQESRLPGTPPMLQRLDPTVDDTSPLGDSLRQVDMMLDLRSPSGFQYVYRMPGSNDLLMRASGGVYAIFPQSVYVQTKEGTFAVIPPGTIYSIGMPGPDMLPWRYTTPPTLLALDGQQAPGAAYSPMERHPEVRGVSSLDRIVSRRDTQSPNGEWDSTGAPDQIVDVPPRHERVRATPPEPSTFLRTIVTDDAYRTQRLAELLQVALKASQGER